MARGSLAERALQTFDRLTDSFPSTVPRLVQPALLATLGNGLFYSGLRARGQEVIRRHSPVESILIIADAGIGDALVLQQGVVTLRQIFPRTRIDYLCNRNAAHLVARMPAADHVYGLLEGNGATSAPVYDRIRALLEAVPYSIVLNFSPFLADECFPPGTPLVDLYVPFGSYIVRLWRSEEAVRHMSSALTAFLFELFEKEQRGSGTITNAIYLSDQALEAARSFLIRHHLLMAERLVLFNPDSTSRFTRIPLPIQDRLLRALVESEETNMVLLAEGGSTPGAGHDIFTRLPTGLRYKVLVLPPLPIDVYAAVLDACDLFLSGDGGSVHIAASWKISASGRYELRNRTSVVSIFGATDAQMYGYDSRAPGYLAAFQRAPSKVFVAPAPCRNITCVDKLHKTCAVVRCFSGLAAEPISQYAIGHLHSLEPAQHSA